MKIRLLLTFLLLLSIAATAQSQPVTLPDTKPGHFAGEWLKFCDAPNVEQMAKWNAANVTDRILKRQSAEAIAKDDAEQCNAQGGFTVAQVKTSDPKRLELLAQGRKNKLWFSLRVGLDEQDKIRALHLEPAIPPASALPKSVTDAELAKDIKAQVEVVSNAGLFSGVVVAARNGEPIVTATGGYQDKAKKSGITPQSQFTIGSMGKMFTAAAIGQLVDQKKLSFDDTVGKFFPEYKNQTVRDKVTIGMLLSHTSGMGDFLGKRTPEMMKNGVKRAAEFMPLYEADELKFEPGKGWSYSNAGLALAGAIVEKVSGEAYPDYIRKHVFEVAGMKNSDPNNIPHNDPRMVTPFTRMTEQGPGTDWHEAEHDIGSPAGGAISTAEDLVRFADALRSGKLVSKETFDQLMAPHGTTPWGAKYGYAMEIDEVNGMQVVGHGGGFPGVSTHLYMLAGTPYTLVVLANQDPPADGYVGFNALALLTTRAKS